MTQKILYLVSEDWYFVSHRLSDLFKGELGRGLINGRQNTGANAQPNVRYWVKQTSFGIVAMPVNDPSATFADVLPVLLPTE